MAAGEQKLLLVWSVMVTTAANQVRDLRVDGLSAHAAERILDSAIAIEKAMAAIKVLVADRAAEGSAWRARGARSAEEDLARRSGTSTAAAKEVLATSKRVKTQPRVEDALRDGKLSERQAAMVSDAAAANPAAESSLLEAAATNDLTVLRDTCGRVKAAGDRDPEATRARLHRERYLRYGKNADGSFTGSFKLAPDAGAHFDALFHPFVQAEARRARKEHRPDTLDQLSADGLVAMAHSAATGDAKKTTPQVNVIVDRDALLRGSVQGEERCEMSTCFGPISIPVSVAQEIIDDAFLSGVFKDGTDVMSYVSFRRHIPKAVRQALLIRDDFTCSVEGCNRRARLEIDHLEPFAQGGPTRMTNARPKCDWHHKQKTNADRKRARAGPAP